MSLKYVTPESEPEQNIDDTAADDDGLVRAEPVVPFFTYILVGSLIIVYIVQRATHFEESFNLADSYHPLILEGEYWRIITGATMHAGTAHIFLNGLALYNLGSAIEYLSNRVHLATVFLLAVIGGGLLSLFLRPDISSVGASGGIVGLVGYLSVYGYKRRQLLPPTFMKNMLINIGILVAIGVVGYQYIDNGAHLGGLITGAVYGFLQVPSDLRKDPREANTLATILGYACLLIFLGFAVLTILLLRKTITL